MDRFLGRRTQEVEGLVQGFIKRGLVGPHAHAVFKDHQVQYKFNHSQFCFGIRARTASSPAATISLSTWQLLGGKDIQVVAKYSTLGDQSFGAGKNERAEVAAGFGSPG
jgi:hypothetical protein